MKSIQIKEGEGLGKIKIIEHEIPVPASGEIRVRWHATSLNYHDYMVAKGLLPTEEGRVPMSDGAGEIDAVGADVSRWKKGDKVMSLFFPKWQHGAPTIETTRFISGETIDGYATEYSVLSSNAVTAMPKDYSYTAAATLPCAGLTAWRALVVEGQIKSGDSVLIEGTGGMSIFALQFARMAGAQVFATTGSNEKIEQLKSMGATEVVNYKEDPKWGKTLFKKTGGIDHVIDVGGNATMRQSIEAAKIYGKIYSIGILGGPKGEILFPKLFFKHLSIIGLAVGSAAMQKEMVKAVNANKFQPMLDKQFALEELGDAFRYQEKGKHFGKIVLEY
jgi:NADPH:quinone reductase and related Zn-dependent oxidoreductases